MSEQSSDGNRSDQQPAGRWTDPDSPAFTKEFEDDLEAGQPVLIGGKPLNDVLAARRQSGPASKDWEQVSKTYVELWVQP